MNLSSRELEAHELLVEGELQADVEGEAGGGPRQVRRVLGRRRIRPYQRLAGIRRRRHPSAARPFHQFGRRVERRAERRRRLEVARVAVEAPGQGQPRRGPSGPWRLGPRRRRRRGAREQRKTEAAQRRAPLQGPRLGLGRDDRELGAAGLDGRRGFGVHSGLTGGGGSSLTGCFRGLQVQRLRRRFSGCFRGRRGRRRLEWAGAARWLWRRPRGVFPGCRK